MAAGGGGSWKVAFADFMTALMALFLVLWIVGQDQEVKGAVEEYFKNPWKAALSDSTGIIPVKNADVVASQKNFYENPSAVPLDTVKQISEDLVKTYIQNPEYRDTRSLAIESTPDGVKISFFDETDMPIFEKDTARFTQTGINAMRSIAWLVARYANSPVPIEIEGHVEVGFKFDKPRTDADGKPMDGWYLSTERALAARRELIRNAPVLASHIVGTTGRGDSRPLKSVKSMDPNKPDRPVKPTDAANRRVTIFLRGSQDPGY